jgi:hypothetical protein
MVSCNPLNQPIDFGDPTFSQNPTGDVLKTGNWLVLGWDGDWSTSAHEANPYPNSWKHSNFGLMCIDMMEDTEYMFNTCKV